MVNWISVRFILVLSELIGLESKAIDFVLSFPQAELDVPVYMELPIGMEVTRYDGERNQHALCLKKILYRLNQASDNCHSMLKKVLELGGFKESVADPCVFIKQSNKGGTSIFRNNVTNPPLKRGSVSVTNSKGSLSTLPAFDISATNTTIKLVTETKSSADLASKSQGDTANKSSIASTNNFWVKNFI